MSGEVSLDRRLSPSGRFITDARSGLRLPYGSGTPGLIWRGPLDAASSPVDIAGGVPINLPGQGGAWDLPLGYRYSVESNVVLRGSAAPTVGDFIVLVEASLDGGATWTVTLLNIDLPSVALGINEARCFTFRNSLAGGGPFAADVTNIRTRSCRVGAAGNATLRNPAWTKIVQYVA